MTKLEDIQYYQNIEYHCHQGTWEDFKKYNEDATEEEYKPKDNEWFVWTDFEDAKFGASTYLSFFDEKDIDDIKKRTFDFLVEKLTNEWFEKYGHRNYCIVCGKEMRDDKKEKAEG